MTAPEIPAALPVEPGARVGKCVVLERIGKGGMGAVFRARHETLDIEVALKVISFSSAPPEERDELIARFQREARAAAKVRHENVVSVLDVDEAAGVHYMVMELVDGTSARRLIEDGPLDSAEAARIAREAALALAAAHRLGIVHRDVKPENILLMRDGRVKVSDFGIAKTHGETDAKLTQTGQVVGTPHYMSPEQVEGTPLDGRADLYSLGATLYHLVTGELPYTGTSALQVCMKHVTAPLPSPRARNPAVPAELEGVIRRLMAKRPADRYADADATATALAPLAGPRRPLGTRGPEGEPSTRAPTMPVTPPYSVGPRTPAAHAPPPTAPPTPAPERAAPRLAPAIAISVLATLAVVAAALGVWARLSRPAATPPPAHTPVVDARGKGAPELFREATDLLSQGRTEAAAAAFDAVADMAKESTSPPDRVLAASALLQAARALEQLGRAREALERAEAVPRDYSDAGPEVAQEARKIAERVRPLASAEVGSIAVARLLPCDVVAARIVVADVNGDGIPDILVPGSPGLVFLSDRAHPGSYERRRSVAPEAGALLGAADLDLTGRPCAITAGPKKGEITLWRYDASARAAVPEVVPPDPKAAPREQPPAFAAAGDFDANGTPDLVFWTPEEKTFTVRRGIADLPARGAPPADRRGTVAFVDEREIALGEPILALFIADVTGEKHDSIVVATSGRNEESGEKEIHTTLYSANKAFEFAAGNTFFRNPDTWFAIAVGDFDGDGTADLLKTAFDDAAGRSLVAFRATGNGFFEAAPEPFRLGFVPWGSVLADVDGDGRADLIALERTGHASTLYVFHSNGDGTFRGLSRTRLENMKDVRLVVVADMDGDGKPDLVLCDYGKAIGILYGDGAGHFRNKP
jgi:hypothetical protein